MFITFEGIDFCGKSTQIELLKQYLLSKNKKVEIIREPGGTVISEKVRDVLLSKVHSEMFIETEIFLFSASRAQLVREKIIPLLVEGVYVLSDRFHDSTTAYQSYGRGIDLSIVEKINALAVGEILPDITFIIDVPIEVAEQRKMKKSVNELDRLEILNKTFFDKVRNGYLKMAEEDTRFKIIDGTSDINEINKNIISEVNKLDKKAYV